MFVIKCDKLELCQSDWMDREYLTKVYHDSASAVATAIEFMPENETIPIYVVDKINNNIIWDSSKAEFETKDGYDEF